MMIQDVSIQPGRVWGRGGGGKKNQSIGYNVSDRSSLPPLPPSPPLLMRFNEELGLINLIPVVEASLHNEKRQNTEGGSGRYIEISVTFRTKM